MISCKTRVPGGRPTKPEIARSVMRHVQSRQRLRHSFGHVSEVFAAEFRHTERRGRNPEKLPFVSTLFRRAGSMTCYGGV